MDAEKPQPLAASKEGSRADVVKMGKAGGFSSVAQKGIGAQSAELLPGRARRPGLDPQLCTTRVC